MNTFGRLEQAARFPHHIGHEHAAHSSAIPELGRQQALTPLAKPLAALPTWGLRDRPQSPAVLYTRPWHGRPDQQTERESGISARRAWATCFLIAGAQLVLYMFFSGLRVFLVSVGGISFNQLPQADLSRAPPTLHSNR